MSNTNYKDFCELYSEHKNPESDYNIYFKLEGYKTSKNFFSFPNPYDVSIVLDEEDIEYFYKKYYKKINQELTENIVKLREEYDKVRNIE